jgi:coxsackievirus/adenovirus receptor
VTRVATTIADMTSTQEREACKDIHCDFEATCELGPDKFPRCSCRFDCGSIPKENMRSVCGSDLRLYSSLCAMKMEACQRQQELRLRPLDLCQGWRNPGENQRKDPVDRSTGDRQICLP